MTDPATPDSAPALPAVSSTSSAPATFVGGCNWRLSDVFWGSPGSKGKGELLGYLARFPTRGRPTAEQAEARVADLWDLQSVYCLNGGTHPIYVGEGLLGDRLKQHAQVDAFVGKWDTFSWLAPATYMFDPNASPPASIAQTDPVSWSPSAKKFVEFLELIAVQFGMPIGNAQVPELPNDVAWLAQSRSQKLPLTAEEMLRALHDRAFPK